MVVRIRTLCLSFLHTVRALISFAVSFSGKEQKSFKRWVSYQNQECWHENLVGNNFKQKAFDKIWHWFQTFKHSLKSSHKEASIQTTMLPPFPFHPRSAVGYCGQHTKVKRKAEMAMGVQCAAGASNRKWVADNEHSFGKSERLSLRWQLLTQSAQPFGFIVRKNNIAEYLVKKRISTQ